MNKFQIINWTQYSKASKQFPICNSELEAMCDALHTTLFNATAQEFESYTELIKYDADDNIVDTYYFI